MSEGSEPPAAPAPTPPAAATPARKPMPTYQRIAYGVGGGVVMLIGIVRLVNAFMPHLPACDADVLQSSMRTTIAGAAHSPVASLTNFRTLSHTDQANRCIVHLTLADARQGDMTYNVTLQNNQAAWHSEGDTPLAVPGQAPSAPAAAMQSTPAPVAAPPIAASAQDPGVAPAPPYEPPADSGQGQSSGGQQPGGDEGGGK